MWDIECGLLDEMGEGRKWTDVPARAGGNVEIKVCNDMV